jgi:hypothetical protein
MPEIIGKFAGGDTSDTFSAFFRFLIEKKERKV